MDKTQAGLIELPVCWLSLPRSFIIQHDLLVLTDCNRTERDFRQTHNTQCLVKEPAFVVEAKAIIYIYQTLFSKATYSAFRLYIFCQYMCSLGIEPTTFVLLTQCSNHWATGTLSELFNAIYQSKLNCCWLCKHYLVLLCNTIPERGCGYLDYNITTNLDDLTVSSFESHNLLLSALVGRDPAKQERFV